MSHASSEESPPSLEDQLKEMLRHAQMSFMNAPSAAPEPAAPPPPEAPEEDTSVTDPLEVVRDFKLKPRDIRDYLDRYVIRQDEAKKVLSVAICDHYNHVRQCLHDPDLQDAEYAKHNVLLLGPTGVGKTYLMRSIARLIGVPFVKADATKFSETGYVGHDVEDLVRDLVKAADGDVEVAQYGIIYVDEVDKIAAASSGGGKDVSGRGVQINLLKLMEETDVSLFSQTDILGQMQAVMDMQRGKEGGARTINTRHILFIVSGAFDKLSEQVQSRIESSRIGFDGREQVEHDERDYLSLAETRDFIDFGFEPEFVGRLPVRVVCNALSQGDLAEIMLKSEGSVLGQYRSDFQGYGIDFALTPDAVTLVAAKAYEEKTGARGLMTVLERTFRCFKFELPSTGISSFEVDPATIEAPDAALAALLESEQSVWRASYEAEIDDYEAEFAGQHDVKITFDQSGRDALIRICLAEQRGMRAICERRFVDMEHGLKLIAANSGRKRFRLTKRFVEEPEAELSKRVAASVKT